VVHKMPYGVPPKQFAATVLLSMSSMMLGSMVVHVIMMPDQTPDSFEDETNARLKAIQAVQKDMLSK